MNTNQKIKELIKKYKDFQALGNPKCSTWNVITDLEALLEPCKHEKLLKCSECNCVDDDLKDSLCEDCYKDMKVFYDNLY